jgi:hypothetical protein
MKEVRTMKRSAIVLALAAVTAAIALSGADADGVQGPSPGITTGWEGVLSPEGKVRYITIENGRNTIVEVVQVRGGRVLRWRAIRGLFGSPLIAYDGTAGGLSGDGKTLVLASFPTVPSKSASSPPSNDVVSRFPVLSTRNLALRAMIRLRGSWAYDAVSPDGSTLFLIEYAGTGPNASYRVRAFDVEANRLLARAIVDRKIGERLMRGQPVTRATSSDGRWAYTLYARTKKEPFVHALDTVRKQAFCIDLPLELGQQRQMGLRLALANGDLSVRNGSMTVVVVNTKTFEVTTS